MNKYKMAISAIGDALNSMYNNVGEAPHMDDVFDSMYLLRELVSKKNNPLSPILESRKSDTGLCPRCGTRYGIKERYKYCPNCGQKIDWGE